MMLLPTLRGKRRSPPMPQLEAAWEEYDVAFMRARLAEDAFYVARREAQRLARAAREQRVRELRSARSEVTNGER